MNDLSQAQLIAALSGMPSTSSLYPDANGDIFSPFSGQKSPGKIGPGKRTKRKAKQKAAKQSRKINRKCK